MKILPGGATVISGADYTQSEGSRRYRVPISREMGARDIAQTVSVYAQGNAPARRNLEGEEVLYVVRGSGACVIDGYRYPLETGMGVYIPPGCAYRVENAGAAELEVVSVCCPEGQSVEVGVETFERE